MVNFSCLLTFSLMTPAESGLEMAELTRPDTDTSLLNTNMSAASWQNIKRQERESFLVWFKRETERVCLLFLLVFSASLISNIGLARHLQNCSMFKFWDEAGSSLWHHDSWAPIWLSQENIQIIGHSLLRSSRLLPAFLIRTKWSRIKHTRASKQETPISLRRDFFKIRRSGWMDGFGLGAS